MHLSPFAKGGKRGIFEVKVNLQKSLCPSDISL